MKPSCGIAPGKPLTHNGMGLYDPVDYTKLNAPLDFAAWDHYPAYASLLPRLYWDVSSAIFVSESIPHRESFLHKFQEALTFIEEERRILSEGRKKQTTFWQAARIVGSRILRHAGAGLPTRGWLFFPDQLLAFSPDGGTRVPMRRELQ